MRPIHVIVIGALTMLLLLPATAASAGQLDDRVPCGTGELRLRVGGGTAEVRLTTVDAATAWSLRLLDGPRTRVVHTPSATAGAGHDVTLGDIPVMGDEALVIATEVATGAWCLVSVGGYPG